MTGYSDEKILREERDEARKEIARLGRVQDQLLTQIQSQKDTIRAMRARATLLESDLDEANERNRLLEDQIGDERDRW